MVIKGNARGSAAGLAKHLERTDTNERVTLIELRGVAAPDLTGALKEMDALGAALRTERTLYHASINIRADEQMTPAQREHAIGRLEAALGLTGQPRAVVEHEKQGRAGEGRIHWHVVWSRTDLEHMRAIRCDHNFRTHELVARELEREFGHARVQGVHVEREGPDGERIERPERTPSAAEMQQAERSGISPGAMKAEISEIWRATDSGRAFAAALEQRGYILARGERRDFVILDAAGEVHSLARRIEGAKTKDVRARMADLDPGQVPDIEQARATQEARQLARAERAADIAAPERTEPALAAFAGSEREGGYQPAGQSEPTHHEPAERDRLSPAGPEKPETPEFGFSSAQSPKPPQVASVAPETVPEHKPDFGDELNAAFARQRENATAARVARSEARDADQALRTTARSVERDARKTVATAGKAFDKTATLVGRSVGLVGKVMDTLAGLFEGFFSGPKPPPSPDEQQREAQAADEAERLADFRQFVAEQSEQLSAINADINRDQQQRARDEYDHAAARRARDAPARDGPER